LKKVLITGFGPFGEDKINPALEVIRDLEDEKITINKDVNTSFQVEIFTVELPVVFNKTIQEFKQAVETIKPDLILSIGQAGGRMGISIERLGVNINDTTIEDNEGNKPQEEPIIQNGPAAYFTTINIRETYQKLKEEEIPTIISNSAGLYVCNNLIYGALHFLATNKRFSAVKFGFIHIPYLPSQVANKKKILPSMSLDLVKKAIKLVIKVNIT